MKINLGSREVILLIITSGSLGAISILLSLMSGFLLTHLPSIPLQQTGLILALLSIFGLGVGLLSYYHERCLLSFQLALTMRELTDTSTHLLALPPSTLAPHPPGALAQQLSDQSQGITTCISAISELLFSAMAVSGMCLMFMWLSASQFFLVIPLIALSMFVKWRLLKFRLKYNESQLNTQMNLATWLTEVILNINKIRLSRCTPLVFKRGMDFFVQLKSTMKSLTLSQIMMTAWDAIFTLSLLMLVMHEASFIALPLLLITGQLSAMLDRCTGALIKYQQGEQARARLQSILDIPLPDSRTKIKIIPDASDLCFHHISYQPTPTGKPLVENISFSLKSGEFLGLIGASGSGKSTLLRLALGLITPTSGRITLNNIDLHHYDLSAWRRTVGAVLQTTQLTHASLYQNISGNTAITLDEAWELAEAVGLADDIRAMPMGMQTRLSDQAGESLSGGQRQKCLLARALAQKPRWLFLDEATSALDNHSQARIQAYLAECQVTRLVVAHRLSSVQDADRIYTMTPTQIAV